MGIETVKAVHSAGWAHLSTGARLVFAMMAGTCLDQPKNGTPAHNYWAGHDTLILMTDCASPGDPGYPAAKRRLSRSIAELLAAGAITRTQAGHRGKQARYVLNPDPPRTTR